MDESERREQIAGKVTEVSKLMTRLAEILQELDKLGCNAAFKYTAGPDGYGGDLEFMYVVRDKEAIHCTSS